MCARSSDRCSRRARGFTLVELVAVILLLSVLAVAVAPKMDLAGAVHGSAWRDQVLAALRLAASTAHSHRRLVCMDIAAGSIGLSIATTNPATSCDASLAGPDGSSSFARDPQAPATTLAPTGTLYFQPDGRVSRDGAGTLLADRSITVAGETAITLTALTGHAR